MFKPVWATLTTVGVGAATWFAVAMAGSRHEAWDSELYFVLVMPLIALTAGAVSFKVPRHFWRWSVFPFAAQAMYLFVQNPNANMLPLGLIMFGIVATMCMIPAAIGAAFGRNAAR